MDALVEYEWPLGSNEKWFIMEHVGDFLSIKSFNRKHRELNARTLSAEEKEELLANKIISPIESALNLQAVKSDDLLDLMAKKYPYKFYLFCLVQNFANAPNEKIPTNVKEIPTKPYIITQDGFIFDRKNYSIHRLQSTPATFYAPVSMENPTQTLLEMKNELLKALDSIKIPENIPVTDISRSPLQNLIDFTKIDSVLCGICGVGNITDDRKPQTPNITCSKCKRSFHLKCLGISRRSIESLKRYNWKCVECKICEKCQNPTGDMIFCDRCDRSYHSLCVGLKEIPLGRWICFNCGFCSSCSKRRPGSCGWITETLKVEESTKKIQIHCSSCSKLFNKGKFCLVCLEGFHGVFEHRNSTKSSPVITCSNCRHLVHKECYDRPLRACLICLGEVERDITLNNFLKDLKSNFEA